MAFEKLKESISENFFGANEIVQRACEGLIADLLQKKDAILIEKLSEHGISIDLEKERLKRFKSITYEIWKDTETWWYNDGGENGLRIVTFRYPKFNFDDIDNFNGKISAQFEYY